MQSVEQTIEIYASQHSGSLPPPEAFRQYDAVLPGCAERIVRLMETEAERRRDMEAGDQKRLYAAFGRGQLFAFIVALTATLAGAFLIYNDKDLTGFTVLVLGLGSAIVPFIRRLLAHGKDAESEESQDAKPRRRSWGHEP